MTSKGPTIDVGAWLRDLGLGQYGAVFREMIDIDILPELTEPHLEKLGMPLGHRIRLLKAISNLEVSEKSAVAVAPAPEPLPTAHATGPPIIWPAHANIAFQGRDARRDRGAGRRLHQPDQSQCRAARAGAVRMLCPRECGHDG
jgi:SAM domain (Sterile alpha motif)